MVGEKRAYLVLLRFYEIFGKAKVGTLRKLLFCYFHSSGTFTNDVCVFVKSLDIPTTTAFHSAFPYNFCRTILRMVTLALEAVHKRRP